MADLILSCNDFKTLSSGTRLQIIKLLASRNYNLTELSAKLKLSAPSIKQHIDVLLASDLIMQIDSNHKWKYYSLSRKGKKIVEPYSSQVLIVLSTSLVGILGIAFIASAVFGFQSLFSLSGSTAARESVKSFDVPTAPAASEAINKAATSSTQQVVQPLSDALTQPAFSNYSIVFLLLGIVFLVFAFLIYKRKINWLR